MVQTGATGSPALFTLVHLVVGSTEEMYGIGTLPS